MTIKVGKTVYMEYTLTLDGGKVVDSNVGGEPMSYVHGSGEIIPGLESSMEGMKVGESKRVSVKPEDAYGPLLKEAFLEVKKERLPESAWKIGAHIEGKDPEGQLLHGEIVEIDDDVAIVDFNHPLAGRNLTFDVKVLDIK